jgi:surfactin synthase thioesterase subunit
MIAYYLAYKLINENGLSPLHLFISGRGALHVKRYEEKKIHLLENDQFIKEVIDLGGTSSEVFQHQELVETFLPVLRNDFKLAETDFDDKITPLNVDISVMLGEEEELTIAQSMGWKIHTTKKCGLHYFNGGHFYLHDQIPQIVDTINKTFSTKDVLKYAY